MCPQLMETSRGICIRPKVPCTRQICQRLPVSLDIDPRISHSCSTTSLPWTTCHRTFQAPATGTVEGIQWLTRLCRPLTRVWGRRKGRKQAWAAHLFWTRPLWSTTASCMTTWIIKVSPRRADPRWVQCFPKLAELLPPLCLIHCLWAKLCRKQYYLQTG